MNDQPAANPVDQRAQSSGDAWPRPAVAWYGVVFFGLTLLVLFMNASISGLLIQPIKRDLGLTDVQAAFAIGTAAAALNALFMLPVSRLVDIISRRLIIGVGLILDRHLGRAGRPVQHILAIVHSPHDRRHRRLR